MGQNPMIPLFFPNFPYDAFSMGICLANQPQYDDGKDR